MSHLFVTEGDWLDALQLDGYHHGILLYNWFVLHMCYNTKLISVVNKKLVTDCDLVYTSHEKTEYLYKLLMFSV